MWRVLTLLIPALIPSWRFFNAIEPSPRVQWAWLSKGAADWQDYRPRPQSLSSMASLRRLFWNPHWNDALYMVSLAERLTIAPTQRGLVEIWRRVALDATTPPNKKAKLQFRLLFVSRETGTIKQEVTYLSDPRHPRDLPR